MKRKFFGMLLTYEKKIFWYAADGSNDNCFCWYVYVL